MWGRKKLPYAVLGKDPDAWPDVSRTHTDGILAIGGDLTPPRLVAAYSRGIFPWYSEGLPILWHSPDPRFVLEPSKLHVPKSLEKQLKRRLFEVRLDTAFPEVMRACGLMERPGQDGTWITSDMLQGYSALHRLGLAHSCEAWLDGQLVGGLYGVSLGDVFFGESMFTTVADASKVAFVTLVRAMTAWGIKLIDCQQETAHLARFGAVPWPREKFIEVLAPLVRAETRPGPWTLSGAP